MSDELRKAAQDVLDGWDDKAVLSITYEMEVLRTALATPTQAAPDTCPDCGKPAPEGSIHTCSPQKPDSDALIADGWRRCAVGQGESQHCPMAEQNARDAARYHEVRKRGAFLYPNGEAGFDAAIDGFLRGEKPPALICPTCKADRYQVDCQGDRMNCGLKATAQQEQGK